MRPLYLSIAFCCWVVALCAGTTFAQDVPPPEGRQQLIEIDREQREVRVRCQALRVDMPLEFFCVLAGTADHETVLRTAAKPSEIHAALLALGLEPGNPLRFVAADKSWIPPSGPPLSIRVEWEEDGQTRSERAGRLIRNMKTGEPMPQRPFVFCGSRVMEDGVYAADVTGQLVSLVNFEYSLIDVPRLVSNANETLEWEINPDTMPPSGTEVWMIITPIGEEATTSPAEAGPTTAPAPETPQQVIVVMVDAQGEVMVDNEPVARASVDDAVKARVKAVTGVDDAAALRGVRVRLTAPRGTPVEAVGRVLGQLVTGGIVDVTFVPPPEEAREAQPDDADAFAEPPLSLRVGDGGRTVRVTEPRGDGFLIHSDTNLSEFIPFIQERAMEPQWRDRKFVVRPEETATDITPVDLAAPAAAIYVLGFDVTVEGLEPPAPATRPTDADATLQALRQRWEQQVLPQGDALQQAAQTHYEVMQAYQDEINRLLDEVEALRREMDQLQGRYNELTTPQPTLGEDRE